MYVEKNRQKLSLVADTHHCEKLTSDEPVTCIRYSHKCGFSLFNPDAVYIILKSIIVFLNMFFCSVWLQRGNDNANGEENRVEDREQDHVEDREQDREQDRVQDREQDRVQGRVQDPEDNSLYPQFSFSIYSHFLLHLRVE